MADTVAEDLEDINLDIKPHPGRRMTEVEFVAWCGDKTRAEWVDGEVIVMSPVSLRHSELGWFLMTLLSLIAQKFDLGTVHGPEVQFRVSASARRRQPDVLFVAKARGDLLKATVVDGAPDLVMEIVSPDSVERDWREKWVEYAAARIREYWIVDPLYKRVELNTLEAEGHYAAADLRDGYLHSTVIPGLRIRPEWLWQEPLPNVLDVLKELGVL